MLSTLHTALVTVIPQMNAEIWLDLANTLINAFAGLLGVLLGAQLSRQHSAKADRRKEVIDCYANFFRTYTDFVGNQTAENKGRVICALEVAKLLCSPDAVDLFSDFESHFLKHPTNIAERADMIKKIRTQGHSDLQELSRQKQF